MPAYATPLPEQTCRLCGRRATHQVFSTRNASHGFYCRRHYQAAVDDLNALNARLGIEQLG
jgi:hypothetical protein